MGNVEETQKIVQLLKTGDADNIQLALQLQKNVELDIRTLVEARLDFNVKFQVRGFDGDISTHNVKLDGLIVNNKFTYGIRSNRKYCPLSWVVKVIGIIPKKKNVRILTATKAREIFDKQVDVCFKARTFKFASAVCMKLQNLYGLQGTYTETKRARTILRLTNTNEFFDFYCDDEKNVWIKFKK